MPNGTDKKLVISRTDVCVAVVIILVVSIKVVYGRVESIVV